MNLLQTVEQQLQWCVGVLCIEGSRSCKDQQKVKVVSVLTEKGLSLGNVYI